MPPKRRPQPASNPTTSAPKKRPSKLAKEHNLTAAQEAEIAEAFSLFANTSTKEATLATKDIRRCLIALDLLPEDAGQLREVIGTLDPESEGQVQYESFVGVVALLMHAHGRGGNRDEERGGTARAKGKGKGKGRARDSDEDEDMDDGPSEEEVRAAFRLFTGAEGVERITLGHLKRVAKELREDVAESTLRDMLKEANGGENVNAGVSLEEFEGVMVRAGVFG